MTEREIKRSERDRINTDEKLNQDGTEESEQSCCIILHKYVYNHRLFIASCCFFVFTFKNMFLILKE